MKTVLIILSFFCGNTYAQDTLLFSELEYVNFDFYGGKYQVKYDGEPFNGVCKIFYLGSYYSLKDVSSYCNFINGRVEGEVIGISDSLSKIFYKGKFINGVKITEFEVVNINESLASIKYYSNGFLDSLDWLVDEEIVGENDYFYKDNHKIQTVKRYHYIDGKPFLYNASKGSIIADSVCFYQYRHYVLSGLSINYHLETGKLASQEFYKNTGDVFILDSAKKYDLSGSELLKNEYSFYVKGNLINGEFYNSNKTKVIELKGKGLKNVIIGIKEKTINFELSKNRQIITTLDGGFDFKLEPFKTYDIIIAEKGYHVQLIQVSFESKPKIGQDIEIVIALKKRKWYQSNKVQAWELYYTPSKGFVYQKQNKME